MSATKTPTEHLYDLKLKRLDWIQKNVGHHEDVWYKTTLQEYDRSIEFFENERRPAAAVTLPRIQVFFYNKMSEDKTLYLTLSKHDHSGDQMAEGTITMSEDKTFSAAISTLDKNTYHIESHFFKKLIDPILEFFAGAGYREKYLIVKRADYVNYGTLDPVLKFSLSYFITNSQ